MENYGEILIYQSDDGLTNVEVKIQDETVWLTQAQLCDLYHTSKSNISEHIKHIFEEQELDESSVVRKFRTTASDGKNYNVTYYNLDMIISLGYRVKSIIATNFRRWATERLKEYMIKGFTMDDERLKGNGGGAYWKELLDRIRDIRSSEKVLYRQVLDLYATKSVLKKCPKRLKRRKFESKEMFAMVREAYENELNKMLELYLHLHELTIPKMTEHLETTWNEIMQDKNHHVIVNEIEGKIVSSCICVIIPNLTRNVRPYAFIENVVTHSDYRGKGYATECLNYARDIAVKKNCYKVMLLTGSKEDSTLNFYRNAGFNSSDKTAFVQWLE